MHFFLESHQPGIPIIQLEKKHSLFHLFPQHFKQILGSLFGEDLFKLAAVSSDEADTLDKHVVDPPGTILEDQSVMNGNFLGGGNDLALDFSLIFREHFLFTKYNFLVGVFQ
jgi:hypothetical protein